MDFHQDIARSSYADMLHDDERNHAYFLAIRAAVAHLVSRSNPQGDRFFKCCDIGTGSGLLSMMIVKSFTDLQYENYHVIAFEAFKPMAACAKKVIETNRMSNKVTIVSTRSEEFTERPMFDLLVAELLDTELIGEGCLKTYHHALKYLCSQECIIIPKEARIFLQPICSQYLQSRQTISNLSFHADQTIIEVEIPPEAKNCCGMPEIDDLQVHNIDDIVELADPEIAFHFKFDQLESLKLNDHKELKFKLTSNISTVPMVIMWWDIIMIDTQLFNNYFDNFRDKYPMMFDKLSCAPAWIRNSLNHKDHFYRYRDEFISKLYGRRVWREHWIRGIYHFGSTNDARKLIGFDKGSELDIFAYHDSHSLWFDLNPSNSRVPRSCECGIHRLLSRSEMAFINGTDGDLITLLGASLKCRPICSNSQILSTKLEFMNLKQNILETSSVSPHDGKWKILMTESGGKSDILIDYSLQDEICWKFILDRSAKGLSIEPIKSFDILCSHVVFNDLSRIRDQVAFCEGFNLEPLDEMIGNSMKQVDESVEPIFLWEYDCHIVGDPVMVSSLVEENINKLSGGEVLRTEFSLPYTKRSGEAIVFWTVLHLIEGSSISTGPIHKSLDNQTESQIRWNRNYKQLVHFIHTTSSDESRINIIVELDLNGLRVNTLSSL